MGIDVARSAPRYSSILVHAGGRPDDDSVTRDAVFMANAFGARLVGVSTASVETADLNVAGEQAVDSLIIADIIGATRLTPCCVFSAPGFSEEFVLQRSDDGNVSPLSGEHIAGAHRGEKDTWIGGVFFQLLS